MTTLFTPNPTDLCRCGHTRKHHAPPEHTRWCHMFKCRCEWFTLAPGTTGEPTT